MHASPELPDRLSKAIASYVEWRGRSRPVSLQRIVKAAHYLMPEVNMPQRQLADLIASDLVAMGCDIEFDLAEENTAAAGASDGTFTEKGKPRPVRATVGS